MIGAGDSPNLIFHPCGVGVGGGWKFFRRRPTGEGGQNRNKIMKFWFLRWRPPVGADRSVSSRRYGRTSPKIMGIKDNLKLFKRVRQHIENLEKTHAHMKTITLPKVLECLEKETNEILIPEVISRRARKAVERMVAIGRSH